MIGDETYDCEARKVPIHTTEFYAFALDAGPVPQDWQFRIAERDALTLRPVAQRTSTFGQGERAKRSFGTVMTQYFRRVAAIWALLAIVLLVLAFSWAQPGAAKDSTTSGPVTSPITAALSESGVRFQFTPIITTGLSQPLFITHAGDERLYVAEKGGMVKIIENGEVNPTPFLAQAQFVSLAISCAHTTGGAAIGGYVYRVSSFPWIQGKYFYADWLAGKVFMAEPGAGGAFTTTLMSSEFGYASLASWAKTCQATCTSLTI